MDRIILCDIMETVSQLSSCCCNYETKNSFVSIFSGRKWSHVKDPACNQRVCPLTQTTGWDKTISRQHFKRRNNAAGWIIYVWSTSMDLSRTLAPSRLLARWGATGLKKPIHATGVWRWTYSPDALCFQIEGIMWVSCFCLLWFVSV